MKVCRIKNPATSLYSRGGKHIEKLWGKRGKAWSDISHMKCHLRRFGRECTDRHYQDKSRYWYPKAVWPYQGCVVEIHDFDAFSHATIPVRDILASMYAGHHRWCKIEGKTLLDQLVERYGEDGV